MEEIVSSLEADARVKVDVFDSAIEGFFLTHDDFLAKPEESAKFRRAGLVCKHCRTCSCGLVDGGLVPGGGPMDRLRRLIGCGRALEVLLTANDINGDLAELYGYANRSLPDSTLDDFVDGLAKRIASFDKQAITGGGEQPVDCRSRRLTWRVRPSMLELARASRSSYRGCNSPRIVGINSDTVG